MLLHHLKKLLQTEQLDVMLKQVLLALLVLQVY